MYFSSLGRKRSETGGGGDVSSSCSERLDQFKDRRMK